MLLNVDTPGFETPSDVESGYFYFTSSRENSTVTVNNSNFLSMYGKGSGSKYEFYL